MSARARRRSPPPGRGKRRAARGRKSGRRADRKGAAQSSSAGRDIRRRRSFALVLRSGLSKLKQSTLAASPRRWLASAGGRGHRK
eukprot:13429235-Alexandrium_andersonii.AAC.1